MLYKILAIGSIGSNSPYQKGMLDEWEMRTNGNNIKPPSIDPNGFRPLNALWGFYHFWGCLDTIYGTITINHNEEVQKMGRY